MQKLRLTLATIAILVIAFVLLFEMDYSNPSFGNNRSSYINLLVSICLAASQICSYIHVKNQSQDG
jgi:hypothetical protein